MGRTARSRSTCASRTQRRPRRMAPCDRCRRAVRACERAAVARRDRPGPSADPTSPRWSWSRHARSLDEAAIARLVKSLSEPAPTESGPTEPAESGPAAIGNAARLRRTRGSRGDRGRMATGAGQPSCRAAAARRPAPARTSRTRPERTSAASPPCRRPARRALAPALAALLAGLQRTGRHRLRLRHAGERPTARPHRRSATPRFDTSDDPPWAALVTRPAR